MAKTTEVISLPVLRQRKVVVKVIGATSLITHPFGQKALKSIEDKQAGKAKSGKHDIRDPEQEYHDSMYICEDGNYGFPAIGFKGAVVTAANDAGIQKVLARRAFHVMGGELVKIVGEPSMRTDRVTIGMGTTDIRYRAEFKEWSAEIPVIFNEGVISLEQLINLFRIAGFGVGIGEWRPERNGIHGTWEVEGGIG
jgi:hypothetical protein